MLDEPTNDLDVETLELLEEILLDFDGTVLLVSHDREFMDNVVTGIFVVEGGGSVSEYVGGYSSWAEKGGRLVNQEQQDDGVSAAKEPAAHAAAAKHEKSAKSNKLSYKDQRELDALPGLIEQLETRMSKLEADMSAPGFYQQDHAKTQAIIEQVASTRSELDAAYGRWEELEGEST